MIKSLRHVGLVVKDPEKALGFYRDLLGFVVLKDQVESGPFVEKILGLAGLKVRTIKMKADDGSLLELLHFISHPSPVSAHPICGQGFSHMALTVRDVDGLFSCIKAQGGSYLSAPEVSVDGRAKVFFCRDLEGNFLELVQELP